MRGDRIPGPVSQTFGRWLEGKESERTGGGVFRRLFRRIVDGRLAGILRPIWRAGSAAVVVPAVVVIVGACDDQGIQGPGSLVARVDAPDVELGSAVVEVQGTGIRGFEALGGSRVFTRSAGGGTHRVVVVDPGGGDLRFRIRVEAVAAALPAATVQAAADTANAVVASGVSLTVGRER